MNTLTVGDKAPNFEAKDNQGIVRKLSDYSGKKLVIFFYPKASTPGCTAEACNLRDHYQTFKAQGYEIIGVSADSEKRQQNFVLKHELPFPLLVDQDHNVINGFGVWGPKKFMGRELYLSNLEFAIFCNANEASSILAAVLYKSII